MTPTLGWIALSLVVLFFAGDALVRGASALAARMGVSALAIGLTVVALGTSAPELAVSLNAALSGADEIALGNVVGSNIANIALILGLACLVRPISVQAQLVRLDVPLMIAVSAVLMVILHDHRIGRIEGALLVAGLLAYILFTLRMGRREERPVRVEFEASVPAVSPSMLPAVLRIGVGLAGLVLGARLLVSGAIDLATALGMSQAAIGLSIVAVGTSVPELAASLVAAIKGEGDIAAGNVVGSNLFNILGILGTTALIRPVGQGGVGWTDLGVMLAVAIALYALVRGRVGIGRLAGAGLVAGYVAYTVWLLA